MLRRIAIVIAMVLTAGTLIGTAASAQPIRNTLPGIGRDMTCDLSKTYRIRTADGYALQISQTAPTGRVIQHWVWGGSEQKWKVCRTPGNDPDSAWTFWNMHNKNCLNMWAGVTGDGGQFTEGECNAGEHQRFARILDGFSGMFLLQVRHSGKFMSVPAGNNSLNAIMTQYSDQAKLFYLEEA